MGGCDTGGRRRGDGDATRPRELLWVDKACAEPRHNARGRDAMTSRWFAALALLACGVLPAAAQPQPATSYPEKTVRLIVPFPAGGATDILARLLAERLNGAWNRPGVGENRSGAAAATGTAQAPTAPAAAYT